MWRAVAELPKSLSHEPLVVAARWEATRLANAAAMTAKTATCILGSIFTKVSAWKSDALNKRSDITASAHRKGIALYS